MTEIPMGTLTPAPESGMYEDTEEDVYQSWNALNQSLLKILLEGRTPKHVQWAATHPGGDTDATRFGTALHVKVLTPHLWDEKVAVSPKFGRKQADLEAKAQWWEDNIGKTVITASQAHQADAMAKSVWEHPAASELLTADGPTEWSGVVRLGEMPCKLRIDKYPVDLGVIVDLKSTQDAALPSFEKSVLNFGYYVQAAWYCHMLEELGYPARAFVLICAEKDAPYLCAVRNIRPEIIRYAWELIQPAVEQMQECFRKDEWPGYPDEIEDVDLPPWEMRKVWEHPSARDPIALVDKRAYAQRSRAG